MFNTTHSPLASSNSAILESSLSQRFWVSSHRISDVAQQGGVTKKIKNVSPRHQELESHEKKQVNLWKEGGSFQCHFQDSSPKIIRLLLNMISTRAEIILYKSDVNMRRSCVKIPKVAFGKKKRRERMHEIWNFWLSKSGSGNGTQWRSCDTWLSILYIYTYMIRRCNFDIWTAGK